MENKWTCYAACSFGLEAVVARELDGFYGRNLGIAVRSLKHASPAIREFVRISRETAQQMQNPPPQDIIPIP